MADMVMAYVVIALHSYGLRSLRRESSGAICRPALDLGRTISSRLEGYRALCTRLEGYRALHTRLVGYGHCMLD